MTPDMHVNTMGTEQHKAEARILPTLNIFDRKYTCMRGSEMIASMLPGRFDQSWGGGCSFTSTNNNSGVGLLRSIAFVAGVVNYRNWICLSGPWACKAHYCLHLDWFYPPLCV